MPKKYRSNLPNVCSLRPSGVTLISAASVRPSSEMQKTPLGNTHRSVPVSSYVLIQAGEQFQRMMFGKLALVRRCQFAPRSRLAEAPALSGVVRARQSLQELVLAWRAGDGQRRR